VRQFNTKITLGARAHLAISAKCRWPGSMLPSAGLAGCRRPTQVRDLNREGAGAKCNVSIECVTQEAETYGSAPASRQRHLACDLETTLQEAQYPIMTRTHTLRPSCGRSEALRVVADTRTEGKQGVVRLRTHPHPPQHCMRHRRLGASMATSQKNHA
jgi:hypothetical protein